MTYNIEALESRLKAVGFSCSIPTKSDGVRKNIYYIDPNGFEIEFVQYNSDLPLERNSD